MSRPRQVPYVRNRLFRGIPRDQLDIQRLVRKRRSYQTGDIIFDEGNEPDYCYLVASGSVRITKALPDGHEELLAVIQPGDFFGELALYDANRRSARATASEPTRLGLLDQESFDYLRRIAPLEMASTIAEAGIERMRQTNVLLVSEVGLAGRLSQMGHELGTLSHNLRSPLATIRNAAQLLRTWMTTEGRDPQRTLRFIDIIHDTAENGLAQIEQLMARLRGESLEAMELVGVDRLLDELRELTAGYFREDSLRYRDQRGGYQGMVYVDRREFLAVLSNLVKNAVEALPEQGGEVAVAVTEDGAQVVFSVRDTGSGIPREHLGKLFERGFTAGKRGGTGLGLAHAREAVQRLGGRIEVASAPGQGTTFYVRIPKPDGS